MTESKAIAVTLDEAVRVLTDAPSVLIFIHQNPDGDALGSGFALAQMLRGMGKTARVVCADEIPHRLCFLMRGQDDCAYTEGMESDYALLCAVDTASTAQLGALSPLAEKITLSLDHHEQNDPFCAHCTVPTASAAGEVLFDLYGLFVAEGQLTPSADIARLLYAAIVSDTGSFKFSNTTKTTLLKAAELLEAISTAEDGGDDLAMLNHRLFSCRTLSELYAQRTAIDSLRLFFDGALGVVLLTEEMLTQNGLSREDFGDIVGIPRSIEGVRIALSVKQSETDPTSFRISSRATEDLDVASVCASFGGGGHRRAAGCTVTAPDAESAIAIVTEAFGRLLGAEDAT